MCVGPPHFVYCTLCFVGARRGAGWRQRRLRALVKPRHNIGGGIEGGNIGGDEATPFDWERIPSRNKQRPQPLPSLVDLSFLKVVTNLDRYDKLPLPHQLKSRVLDFLIRIHGGVLQRGPEFMDHP